MNPFVIVYTVSVRNINSVCLLLFFSFQAHVDAIKHLGSYGPHQILNMVSSVY